MGEESSSAESEAASHEDEDTQADRETLESKVEDSSADKKVSDMTYSQDGKQKASESTGSNDKISYSKCGKNKRERSIDGSVGLIYHKDPETGEVEFMLEENPGSYKVAKERYKIRMIGGAIDIVGGSAEGSYTALKREFSEEVKGPSGGSRAKDILIRYLNKGEKKPIYTITEDIDGKEAKTDVYEVNVVDSKDWAVLKQSYLGHDAGVMKFKTMDELLNTPDSYFSFEQGPGIKEYLKSNFLMDKAA